MALEAGWAVFMGILDVMQSEFVLESTSTSVLQIHSFRIEEIHNWAFVCLTVCVQFRALIQIVKGCFHTDSHTGKCGSPGMKGK